MNQNVVTMILKNGNATGIIQCNLDEWIGVSYKIPRSKIKEAKELKGINNTGVYILFGVDETTGENELILVKQKIYMLGYCNTTKTNNFGVNVLYL